MTVVKKLLVIVLIAGGALFSQGSPAAAEAALFYPKLNGCIVYYYGPPYASRAQANREVLIAYRLQRSGWTLAPHGTVTGIPDGGQAFTSPGCNLYRLRR